MRPKILTIEEQKALENRGVSADCAPAPGSAALLDSVKSDLYRIAAELGDIRDELSGPPYGACAWEISQTIRSLGIAVETIERVKRNDSLPTLEDVQRIYRQNAELTHGANKP